MDEKKIRKRVSAYLERYPLREENLNFTDTFVRDFGAVGPWSQLYETFFLKDPQLYAALYICQQINLLREIDAYKFSTCDVDDTFLTAVAVFAEKKGLSFAEACVYLEERNFETINEHFSKVLVGIMNKYGIKNESRLAALLGYDYDVIRDVTLKQSPPPKILLYSLCLFLEYDIHECEELFLRDSPYTLHHCFPDNIFREYVKDVKSGNTKKKGIQPYVDLVYNAIKNTNKEHYKEGEEQKDLYKFYKAGKTTSYLVVSDFRLPDGTYDFSPKRIREKILETLDERSGVEPH